MFRPRGGTGGTPWRAWGPPTKVGGLRSRRGGKPTGRGCQGCLVAWPDGIRGLDSSIRGLVGRPLWGRRAADEGRRLAEGVFFSNQKNTPSRFPRKIVRGDGVVTSSISLAAAQRAPAHSFRCSSFSHRKTLRWEPCISPLTTPLKRPKERPAGLSFGNLLGGGRGDGGYGGRWDGGRGSGAGCVGSFRGFRLVGDEVEEGVVVLAPGLGGRGPCRGRGRHAGVVVPYGWVRRAPSTTPASRRIAKRLRRRGRGTGWESAQRPSKKGDCRHECRGSA